MYQQPIETAPKDGAVVILTDKGCVVWVEDAHCDDDGEFVGSWVLCDPNGTLVSCADWGKFCCEPRRWMPLPAWMRAEVETRITLTQVHSTKFTIRTESCVYADGTFGDMSMSFVWTDIAMSAEMLGEAVLAYAREIGYQGDDSGAESYLLSLFGKPVALTPEDKELVHEMAKSAARMYSQYQDADWPVMEQAICRLIGFPLAAASVLQCSYEKGLMFPEIV